MTSDLSGAPADAGSSDARRNVEDVLPLLANQHVLVLFAGLPGDEDPGFLQVRFTLTDFAHEQVVRYEGILPDLFREGQGIVANGRLDANGMFIAAWQKA